MINSKLIMEQCSDEIRTSVQQETEHGWTIVHGQTEYIERTQKNTSTQTEELKPRWRGVVGLDPHAR